MVARLSAIIVGIVITVIFWSVLSGLMPSSFGYTTAELDASFIKRFFYPNLLEWLTVLIYAAAAMIGGTASTFVRQGHSLKTAAAIGSFYPLITVLATSGTHVPVGAGWAHKAAKTAGRPVEFACQPSPYRSQSEDSGVLWPVTGGPPAEPQLRKATS